MDQLISILSEELGQKVEYVENVVRLLDEGNTVPFIARYRKELHGAMDDTVLRTLETRLQYLRNLQERRETVLGSIEEQGKLTEELAAAIGKARTLAELEDLYRPYKQKRPALPSRRRKGSSLWRNCFSARIGTALFPRRPQRRISIRKRAWKP